MATPSGNKMRAVDLTAQELADQKVAAQTSKYDAEPGRDETRRILAYCLIGIFIAEIVSIIIMLSVGVIATGDLEKLGATIISPTIAILGSVLGFYYGAAKASRST